MPLGMFTIVSLDAERWERYWAGAMPLTQVNVLMIAAGLFVIFAIPDRHKIPGTTVFGIFGIAFAVCHLVVTTIYRRRGNDLG